MRLYGFLGNDRVQADLALVDDTVYVFTDVSGEILMETHSHP